MEKRNSLFEEFLRINSFHFYHTFEDVSDEELHKKFPYYYKWSDIPITTYMSLQEPWSIFVQLRDLGISKNNLVLNDMALILTYHNIISKKTIIKVLQFVVAFILTFIIVVTLFFLPLINIFVFWATIFIIPISMIMLLTSRIFWQTSNKLFMILLHGFIFPIPFVLLRVREILGMFSFVNIKTVSQNIYLYETNPPGIDYGRIDDFKRKLFEKPNGTYKTMKYSVVVDMPNVYIYGINDNVSDTERRFFSFETFLHAKLIKKYSNVEKAFIGVKYNGQIKTEENPFSRLTLGNSILLYLGGNKYSYIEYSIKEFEIEEKIIDYYSNMHSPIAVGFENIYYPRGEIYANKKYFPIGLYKSYGNPKFNYFIYENYIIKKKLNYTNINELSN